MLMVGVWSRAVLYGSTAALQKLVRRVEERSAHDPKPD